MAIRLLIGVVLTFLIGVNNSVKAMHFPLPCEEGIFGVGVGRADITGPIAETSMMGYADFSQKAQGLHMRLWSRAFVIYDPCNDRMSAVVIADLGMIFSSIKSGVIAALQSDMPQQFNHENVLLSATHTHSGIGGYAFYPLYNLTTLGFDRKNYDAIVAGIVSSIRQATRSLSAAHISYGSLDVEGIGFNRSLAAYQKNPLSERSAYVKPINETMHLLKFEKPNGDVIGAINWLSVHPVSLTLKNKLVSGDNKGLAAFLLEKKMSEAYQRDVKFVGAFAQADAGDVSPYEVTQPPRNDDEEWAGLWRSAVKQADAAWTLLHDQLVPLEGPLVWRHQFVDISRQVIVTPNRSRALCSAALGLSFAAGTENGKPALALFDEGMVSNEPTQGCQKEKPVLINAGDLSLVPNILPFQIVRIGDVTIAAAPSEMTTMAGRRLREHLATITGGPVIIAGLSNEYSHYVATREEYAAQHYEGASTLYGPWTELAYRSIFSQLADALVTNTDVEPGPMPMDMSHLAKDPSFGVIFDSAPFGKNYGDVAIDARAHYRRGQTISVSFVGAHPNNDLKTDDSYLTVERLENGQFKPVLYDNDPNTIMRWQRKGLAQSVITVDWRTTSSDSLGDYRICHAGAAITLFSRQASPYRGCSGVFSLTP